MSAAACLKMAIASGVDLYVEAGRLRGRGPRPEPELAATLREHATDARGFSLKAHLGLDDLPSWIVVTETNDFLWPGPDLWPLPGTKPNRYDYGMLPPRFFTHIRDKILQAHLRRRLNRVQRSE
jgi:hypothetical protein